MTHPKIRFLKAALLGFSMLLAGCQVNSKDQIMKGADSQVALRQIQSRSFETTDKSKTLRTVIATLQDLGFIVDKADQDLGTVSSTKLNGYSLRMTVTVREKDAKNMIVRANAQYNETAIEDPTPYQQFFGALEKAMFLTAQKVD